MPTNIEQQPTPWSGVIRWLASGLLCAHLLAIFSAPWSFPAPSSQLSRVIAGFFQPYQTATFTRHGYRFFAPDPGPAHLIRYEIEMADGNVITGKIPDRDQIWPRLLYHRHFMISETAFSVEQTVRSIEQTLESAPKLEELTREERVEYDAIMQELEASRSLAETLRKGLARRLLDTHQSDNQTGDRIRLYMSVHAIPTPNQLLDGNKLTDQEFYADLYLMREFTKDEL